MGLSPPPPPPSAPAASMCLFLTLPPTRSQGKDCKKHTVHKVTQYKTGKASLYAQGECPGAGDPRRRGSGLGFAGNDGFRLVFPHSLSLFFLPTAAGKRRYDRKQSGYGGQTKPVFHKKARGATPRDRFSPGRGQWGCGAGKGRPPRRLTAGGRTRNAAKPRGRVPGPSPAQPPLRPRDTMAALGGAVSTALVDVPSKGTGAADCGGPHPPHWQALLLGRHTFFVLGGGPREPQPSPAADFRGLPLY